MAHPSVTVEQFFKEHGAALQMRLVADGGEFESHHPRADGQPARPGVERIHPLLRLQTRAGHRPRGGLLSAVAHDGGTRERVTPYLFAYKIPCIVFSRGLKPDKEFLHGGGKGRRAGFSNAARDDEVHQRRHARTGNDVRAARHGNRQHGGHSRRGRDHSRRKRHRQKRSGAGVDRTRLQPGFRRCDEGDARRTAAK